MKLLKKIFKALLIYGFGLNFLYGITTALVCTYTNFADYDEAKASGNSSAKLGIDMLYEWKQIIKNLKEIKKQFIRMWKAA